MLSHNRSDSTSQSLRITAAWFHLLVSYRRVIQLSYCADKQTYRTRGNTSKAVPITAVFRSAVNQFSHSRGTGAAVHPTPAEKSIIVPVRNSSLDIHRSRGGSDWGCLAARCRVLVQYIYIYIYIYIFLFAPCALLLKHEFRHLANRDNTPSANLCYRSFM